MFNEDGQKSVDKTKSLLDFKSPSSKQINLVSLQDKMTFDKSKTNLKKLEAIEKDMIKFFEIIKHTQEDDHNKNIENAFEKENIKNIDELDDWNK
jgi:hypothetical protein